jgi:molybdenum-dependent DNA-binding transcriptional regulator ModE
MCVNEQQAMANRKPSQSWDNFRYFLAVARTGTLSAAAEQLETEHTTVARHIHALEEELNSRLVHRQTRLAMIPFSGVRRTALSVRGC